ncbi:MAG: exonuclease SbcCD subunit D [Candidatus Bathyarchaeota archaeon]
MKITSKAGKQTRSINEYSWDKAMYKFAHLADCHIGANREPVLQELELKAFKEAIDYCIEEKVDFVLIAGDLFHSNIPDMRVTNEAVRKMRELKEENIPIYVIYGSHDYSPNETSIIDILDSAGLITKIVKGKIVKNKLKLEVFKDPKTDAKLVGISARKLGLEKSYFEILDREILEKETGFKIFAFHSAVSEVKPGFLTRMESMPASYLPKGFDYYAGGHVHQHMEGEIPEYKYIVYPGPLFAGYARDLEDTAKGEERGFYTVSFDGKGVREVKFHRIKVCDSVYHEFDVSNKNSLQAKERIMEELDKLDVKGKVVVLRIAGELSGGKTSDISMSEIRTLLTDKGAVFVSINRYGLTSKEYAAIKAVGEDVQTIERRLFQENIGTVKVENSKLKGEGGVKLAEELLRTLKQEQKLNETKKDYTERIVNQAIHNMGLEEELE